jgi:hypothetical protein
MSAKLVYESSQNFGNPETLHRSSKIKIFAKEGWEECTHKINTFPPR